MKIYEIIVESPEGIKMMINIKTNFDIDMIKTQSDRVREQFRNGSKDSIAIFGMKSMLFTLNQQLSQIVDLDDWHRWIKHPDGAVVMNEIDDIYNQNMELMGLYR